MKCPKCGHEQEGGDVCESCGIYFAKYEAARLRKEQLRNEQKYTEQIQQDSKSRKMLPALVVVIALVGMYALFGDDATDTDADNESAISGQGQPLGAGEMFGIKERLQKSHAPRNIIEASRNATVFIETGWGSVGSGFIVSENCHVVTNKHVVYLDVDQVLETAKKDPGLNQELLKEYVIKSLEIKQLTAQYDYIIQTEGDTLESDELAEEIEKRQQYLEDLPDAVEQKMDEAAEDLRTKGQEGITIKLIDDTSFAIKNIHYSETVDLALFKLPAENCPSLKLDEDDDIPQGTRLYTIGNPSGLGYTVTSGIFSGYREIENRRFIQTDASINPGNSGGPLIKENGHVVGVNTLVLKGTQGIGFAVPASVVKKEFGHLFNSGAKQ